MTSKAGMVVTDPIVPVSRLFTISQQSTDLFSVLVGMAYPKSMAMKEVIKLALT